MRQKNCLGGGWVYMRREEKNDKLTCAHKEEEKVQLLGVLQVVRGVRAAGIIVQGGGGCRGSHGGLVPWLTSSHAEWGRCGQSVQGRWIAVLQGAGLKVWLVLLQRASLADRGDILRCAGAVPQLGIVWGTGLIAGLSVLARNGLIAGLVWRGIGLITQTTVLAMTDLEATKVTAVVEGTGLWVLQGNSLTAGLILVGTPAARQVVPQRSSQCWGGLAVEVAVVMVHAVDNKGELDGVETVGCWEARQVAPPLSRAAESVVALCGGEAKTPLLPEV
ncbi:hypothetical protein E2C01_011692 [Portunus trituberculatus]|uniref:Uncharacterized protein n=1 Tax=Portunus trituberculatus TaxID=210409 RepID=A0A5B7DC50_PORTR|nr:hypothetical protein [Portunus trituberculatus]